MKNWEKIIAKEEAYWEEKRWQETENFLAKVDEAQKCAIELNKWSRILKTIYWRGPSEKDPVYRQRKYLNANITFGCIDLDTEVYIKVEYIDDAKVANGDDDPTTIFFFRTSLKEAKRIIADLEDKEHIKQLLHHQPRFIEINDADGYIHTIKVLIESKGE